MVFTWSLVENFTPVVRELNRGSYQFEAPFVMSSQAATDTFGVTAKPWNQVIGDLVQFYLDLRSAQGS